MKKVSKKIKTLQIEGPYPHSLTAQTVERRKVHLATAICFVAQGAS